MTTLTHRNRLLHRGNIYMQLMNTDLYGYSNQHVEKEKDLVSCIYNCLNLTEFITSKE